MNEYSISLRKLMEDKRAQRKTIITAAMVADVITEKECPGLSKACRQTELQFLDKKEAIESDVHSSGNLEDGKEGSHVGLINLQNGEEGDLQGSSGQDGKEKKNINEPPEQKSQKRAIVLAQQNQTGKKKGNVREPPGKSKRKLKNMQKLPHSCHKCGKKFALKALLNRHMDCHSEVPQYKCPVCHKPYKHRHNLTIHMGLHDESLAQKCPQCDYKCGSAAQLRQHMVVHEAYLYECVRCKKFFKSKVFFKHHMRLHSNTNISVCEICGKKFPLLCLLRKHMESHSTEYKYACPDCGNRYKQLRGLRRHEIEKHNKASKSRFECQVCGKVWASRTTLRKHEETHKKVTSYKCDLCGEMFTRRALYDIHVRLHSAINKTYKCDICSKLFSCRSWLESHKNGHFEGSRVKCYHCDDSFTNKYTLNRHIKLKHGLQMYSENCVVACQEPNDCKKCVKLWPVRIGPITCQLVHGKNKDVRVVVDKLRPADLSRLALGFTVDAGSIHNWNDSGISSAKGCRSGQVNQRNAQLPTLGSSVSCEDETDSNVGHLGVGVSLKSTDSSLISPGVEEHSTPDDSFRELGVIVSQSNGANPYMIFLERVEQLRVKEETLEADPFPTSFSKEIDLSQVAQSRCTYKDKSSTAFGIKSIWDDTIVSQNLISIKCEEESSSHFDVAEQVVIDTAFDVSAFKESQKIINIAPIGEIQGCESISEIVFNSSGHDNEIIIKEEDCSESLQNECLLVNDNQVAFKEKMRREYPFLCIRREHSYCKFSDLAWIANHPCIHGNIVLNLENLISAPL